MTVIDIDTSDDTSDSLLRIDDIHKTFLTRSRGRKIRTYAVRGVSFSIKRGERVGLVGESGCGKTTLARMVAGLEIPTRGVMSFVSKPLRFTKAIRRKISVVFQDPYASLNPKMIASSIIREPMHMLDDNEISQLIQEVAPGFEQPAEINGSWLKRFFMKFESRRRTKERNYASALMQQVQLRPEWAHRYAHEFSGGQKQRIGIARALATSPELLILDEPVSALDISVQAGVISLLNNLAEQKDMAMLFISHDLRVVHHLCDRVVVMYLGQIMEDAPSELLFSYPRHPYTRALLGSIPKRPDEKIEIEVENSDKSDDIDKDRKLLDLTVLSGDLPSPTNPPEGCPFRTRCERATQACLVQPPLATMSDGRRIACHFPY